MTSGLTDTTAGSKYYVALVVVTLIQLGPIWTTRYPALADFPNHLARAFIIYHHNEIPEYKAIYEVNWRPIPNLAIDLVIPTLLNFVSLQLATKIFLSMIVVLFNWGCHTLGAAAHGKPNWIALTTSFFTYNFAFSFGFVNYLFGLGVFFVTLGVWLRFQGNWSPSRMLLFSFLVVISYLSHLSSYAFLGIAVFILTVRQSIHTRSFQIQQVLGLLSFVPPLIALVFYMHANLRGGAPMEWWRPLAVKKLIGLSYPFISHYIYFDLAVGLLFIVGLLFLLTTSRGVNTGLLLVGCALAASYFVSPMSGGGLFSYLDRRFVVPAIVLIVLAFKIPVSGTMGKTIAPSLVICLLVLSIVRTGAVWKFWHGISQDMQVQVDMLNMVPIGAKIFPIFMGERTAGATAAYDMNFVMAPHYATINRYTFCPTIFAGYGAEVLRIKNPSRGPFIIGRETLLTEVDWDRIFRNYEYVWCYKLTDEYKNYLLKTCELTAQAGQTMLFRIRALRNSTG